MEWKRPRWLVTKIPRGYRAALFVGLSSASSLFLLSTLPTRGWFVVLPLVLNLMAVIVNYKVMSDRIRADQIAARLRGDTREEVDERSGPFRPVPVTLHVNYRFANPDGSIDEDDQSK